MANFGNEWIGASNCSYNYTDGRDLMLGNSPIFRGIYHVCGKTAYFNISSNWIGSCYLLFFFPRMYHAGKMNEMSLKRVKHGFAHLLLDIFGVLIPPICMALYGLECCLY